MRRIPVVLAAVALLAGCASSSPAVTNPGNVSNPAPASDAAVKLIFIHHSTGEAWLGDESGGLGIALRDNNYFVSDTNYGWGPVAPELGGPIGDYTDIGNWWNWFFGPSGDTVMSAVLAESGQNSSYSRLARDPGGENQIVMFKSCFPNSNLGGSPDDPPTTGPSNPLEGAGLDNLTVGNAKRLYLDLLEYFGTHADTLFVVITAPPLIASDTTPEAAANARAFNRWLVEHWLDDYPLANVGVFDFYDVLTSNGGDPNTNDLGAATGNHHRYVNGQVEYVTDQGTNVSAYAVDGDSHPTPAGDHKATAEFVPMLNFFYARWKDGR